VSTAVVELTPSTSSPEVMTNTLREASQPLREVVNNHDMVELYEAAEKKIPKEFERRDGKLKKNAFGPVVKVRLKLIITVNYCFCNQRWHSNVQIGGIHHTDHTLCDLPTIHGYNNSNNNNVNWLSHSSMQPPESKVWRQRLLLPERKTRMLKLLLILMADISLSRLPLRPSASLTHQLASF